MPATTPLNTTGKADASRSRGGLADQVSRQIADEIVLGHFAPGTRLDEMSLAKRYAVSRTPVREALKQLEIMGFVESRLNRGSIVAAMSAEQVDQMFETIGELEAACARHAAVRMSEAEKAALRAEKPARGRGRQAPRCWPRGAPSQRRASPRWLMRPPSCAGIPCCWRPRCRL